MKSVVVLLVLLVGTLTASTSSPFASTTNCPDIDENAWMTFSMLVHQTHNNGSNMDINFIVEVSPSLLGSEPLSCQEKIQILVGFGVEQSTATNIIMQIMPNLWRENKTTEETLMVLMVYSKELCKDAHNITRCELRSQAFFPLIGIETERGCDGFSMTSSAESLAHGEMCVCDDQSNSLFWVTLFQQIKSNRSLGEMDRFPAAATMLLNEQTCTGKLKIANTSCSCSAINRGNEPLYMQYHMTSDEVQSRLSPEERIAVRNALGSPTTRQFSSTLNVNDYITTLLGPNINPSLLSLLLNQGAGNNELIRQLVLSTIGLDSSLLQVILNGGFDDGPQQVNFISYLTQLGVLDPSVIPLLFNVNNGPEFFITSLINNQQLDPTAALLLLGQQSGLPTDQILELIIRGANQNNPDFFESLGRPYIPPLPEGIFPGSRLFFAHFETLGVNTCALHDLRNRFECGYLGITAEACEVVPYCCYSPTFMTDQEVRNATNFAITSVSAIPWCYYNIFFIYFDSFYLPVLRPGEFASPVECVGLFRFGLNVDPSIISIVGTQSSTFSSLLAQRSECGFPGITEFQCVAIRGCCWEENVPFRVPQCYIRNGPTQISFNYNNIPDAYKPDNGSCNVNVFRIPILYYQRVACHYTIDFHKIGHNLLSFPTRLDCLTKLGCCWEDNEEVLERYPFTPQCYKRVGGLAVPAIVPSLGSLFQRSGFNIDQNLYPRISSIPTGK